MATKKRSGGRGAQRRTGKSARRKPARPAPTVPRQKDWILVRTSERTSFKRCRHAWQLGWIEKLKQIEEAPALRFGSLIHKALEERYPVGKRRGPLPAETFARLYDEELTDAMDTWGFRDADGTWAEARDLGVNMLEGYVERYGKDEEWEVLKSEMPFHTHVFAPCPRCGDPGGDANERSCDRCGGAGLVYAFTYVGTIDSVWRNRMDDGVRIVDYKTCKGDAVQEARTKTLDDQTDAYWTFGADFLIAEKMLPPRALKALDGMLYIFMRKAKRDERPQNAQGQYLNNDGSISARQPPANFHRELVYRGEPERVHIRARAIAEVRDMLKLRGEFAEGDRTRLYKAPHFLNCKICSFRDMCELHEIGGDWESYRDAAYRTYEPYEAHEIEAAETAS